MSSPLKLGPAQITVNVKDWSSTRVLISIGGVSEDVWILRKNFDLAQALVQPAPEPLFLIQYDEDEYWLAFGMGTTTDRDKAHRYTRAQAVSHVGEDGIRCKIVPEIEPTPEPKIWDVTFRLVSGFRDVLGIQTENPGDAVVEAGKRLTSMPTAYRATLRGENAGRFSDGAW